ncbi:hypothetical protein FIM08_04055 [SAR202 cluster bacterium AC-647-N09_OGT_505m]|nr:hypothetical protein [SAR202 cluster bacterium AC-647-N09_OGT_505m]
MQTTQVFFVEGLVPFECGDATFGEYLIRVAVPDALEKPAFWEQSIDCSQKATKSLFGCSEHVVLFQDVWPRLVQSKHIPLIGACAVVV